MKTEEREASFLEHIRSELDREADNLDAETQARLKRIRYSALEQHESTFAKWWRLFRIPAVAVATAAIIAVIVTTNFKSSDLSRDNFTVTDLEILTSDEQLDLFDDLDFYYWLAENKNNAS